MDVAQSYAGRFCRIVPILGTFVNQSTEVQGRRDFLLRRATHHTNNLVMTSEKIELGIPTLVVNTDDGL